MLRPHRPKHPAERRVDIAQRRGPGHDGNGRPLPAIALRAIARIDEWVKGRGGRDWAAAIPAPGNGSTVTEGARSSRAWWLLAGAAVIGVVGVARLVLDVSATVLASSVSCGNALSWMGGADKSAGSTFLAACSAPLHNASIEGSAAVVAAVILALGWLVAVRARWPLAVLAALVVLIFGTFVGGPAVGIVAAAALLFVFSVWRLFARRRHAH